MRNSWRKEKKKSGMVEKERRINSAVEIRKTGDIAQTKAAGDVDGAASGASEERRREKRENGRRSRFGGRIFS